MIRKIRMLILSLSCLCLSCSDKPKAGNTPVYSYRIIKTYPHRIEAFTQGLAYADNGTLYEGTGEYGHSSISILDLESGGAQTQIRLPQHLWGEGITIFDHKLYQLTYKAGIGFVYDVNNFNLLKKWQYDTEGWGLTHDDRQLIMSDGSATLRWLDPNSLKVTRTLNVTDQKQPVASLNELEYINGRIYANLWLTEHIAIIDPNSGHIDAYLDLTGLKARNPMGDVLNGIAYEPQTHRLLVTGKLWSEIYEIEIVKKP